MTVKSKKELAIENAVHNFIKGGGLNPDEREQAEVLFKKVLKKRWSKVSAIEYAIPNQALLAAILAAGKF